MKLDVKLIVKRISIYGSIAVFALIVGFYVYGGRLAEQYKDYSSKSTAKNGIKALYLLTEQMKYDVIRYERPARFLPDNVTVVAVVPGERFNDKLERKYLKAWLKRGNKLILAADMKDIKTYDIEGMGLKYLRDNKNGDSIFGGIGSGELTVIDGVQFTNSALKNTDNAVHFISLLDQTKNKTVLFNEYYHGQGAEDITFWDLLGQSGTLVLIQILLAVALFMYISSRRFGRPEVVFEIIKRKENENLFALSSMYIKARAYSMVLVIYLDYFKKHLSRFLGFSYIPDETELYNEIPKNSYLAKTELLSVLNYCKLYIYNEDKDTRQLVSMISRLEKIRKEINK